MEVLEPAQVERAAAAIAAADAILIAAGAGMGVDSGLPDFRGDEGFWRAYPPLRTLGVSFVDMANPGWFGRDPELAWGFYGHRLHLYRSIRPHGGFEILRRWCDRADRGGFVFTSNVDGQFQLAGFDGARTVECHGSLNHLQCTEPCSDAIWDAGGLTVDVDPDTFRAASPLPECPSCGRLARPNVLMFGDWSWVPHRTHHQELRLSAWLDGLAGARVAVVELGAGTAVPTVRLTAERITSTLGADLIRVNLREPAVPRGQIGLAAGALEALTAIDNTLRSAPRNP